MRRFLLPVAALLAGSVPASACIWDSELPGHEREFRSSYEKQQAKAEESSATQKYLPWAAGGVGAVLLVAGGVVMFRGSNRS